MATVSSGVYPVWENAFKVGTEGISSADEQMVTIADMETFSLSIDANNEEWSPFDAKGWMRRLNTGKGFSITLSGKRHIGDAGNDYLANLAWKTGTNCNTKVAWEFPSGAKLEFNAVVNVTNVDGGESRNVAPLEVELLSDGAPTYTPAPESV